MKNQISPICCFLASLGYTMILLTIKVAARIVPRWMMKTSYQIIQKLNQYLLPNIKELNLKVKIQIVQMIKAKVKICLLHIVLLVKNLKRKSIFKISISLIILL